MASSGEKSLAVGHIPGFQIDPNNFKRFSKFMQDVTGICVYISEARKKQISGGDPMEDQGIVALFFDRSEQAIAETDKKYGAYCYAI